MRDWHQNGDHDTPTTRDTRAIPNDASKAVYDEFKRMYEAEQTLSLGDLFGVLRRRLWLILVTGLVCAGLAGGYSLSQTSTYEASVKMLLTSEPKSGAPVSLQDQIYGLQALLPSVTELAMTRPVAQDVVRRLDLTASPATLLGGLRVEPSTEGQFFTLTYTDTDPERARSIANSFGEVLSEDNIISEVNPGNQPVEARVWEPAELPGSPVSPDPVRNSLLMLLFGLMLGAGLALLLEFLDDGWKSPYEAEQVLGVPTFGIIPAFKVRTKAKRRTNNKSQ